MLPATMKELSQEQRKRPSAISCSKIQKHCRKIKGHGCTDGQKQQAYISKEDSTSPTFMTEAVFLTAVMDAWENHNVAVMDVSGVFMQANVDKVVHVCGFMQRWWTNCLKLTMNCICNILSKKKACM